jgi:diguanylate cyclase (GGDEF)-like protein
MPLTLYMAIIAVLALLCVHLYRKNLQLKEIFEERIRNFTTRDQLTGLYNRMFFDELYRAEIERALSYVRNKPQEEENHFFALSFFSVDNFREINAMYGRDYGDKLLKRIADIFSRMAFSRDVLCRYGGAEFIVLFTNTADKDQVTAKTAAIKKEIEALKTSSDNEKITARLFTATGTAFFDQDFILGDIFSVLKTAEQKATGQNRK